MAEENDKQPLAIIKPTAAPWEFQATAMAPKTGLILVYDLEGFTSFLETPDIQRAALRYLNFVDRHVRMIYDGGRPFYDAKNLQSVHPLTPPIHRKFLGDGAMMIFDMNEVSTASYQSVLRNFCTRSWNFKIHFEKINAMAREFMPTAKLPSRIRFGITFGTIYELTRVDQAKEYLGIPINMAARLQKYAGTAGCLISARVDLPAKWFAEEDFVKVRPLKLRNGKNEYVYIDKEDLKEAKKGLFETVSFDAVP